MPEGASREVRERDGLSWAVAVAVLVVVVVAVAVLVYTRVVGDGAGTDLSVGEMETVLISEVDVDRRAASGEPFASIVYDGMLAGPAAGFVGAEASTDFSRCHELVQRILPGQRDPAAVAAFERSDGSIILQTVDRVRDGDMSVSELSEWRNACGFPLAATGGGGLAAWFVPRRSLQVDDLGDAALWMSMDLQGPPDEPPRVQRDYLHVVVVERAGVVTTVTVIAGSDLRDARQLALGLARAADRKLADSL